MENRIDMSAERSEARIINSILHMGLEMPYNYYNLFMKYQKQRFFIIFKQFKKYILEVTG